MKLSTRNKQFLILLAIYCVIFVIAEFFYQRYVLNINVQALDISYRQVFINQFEKTSFWIFIIPIAFLLIRTFGGGTIMYIGSFFSEKESINAKIGTFFSILLKAQWIMIVKEVIRVILYITNSGTHLNTLLANYTSLNNLYVQKLFRNYDIYPYFASILESIDLFQLLFWFMIAWGVSKVANKSLGKSYWFVMKTYGLGFVLLQICLVFIFTVL